MSLNTEVLKAFLEKGKVSDPNLVKPEETKWSPDPFVMGQIETALNKMGKKWRLAFGAKVFTWQELLEEVRKGTPIGRDYYSAFMEGLKNEEPFDDDPPFKMPPPIRSGTILDGEPLSEEDAE